MKWSLAAVAIQKDANDKFLEGWAHFFCSDKKSNTVSRVDSFRNVS